MVSFLGEWRDNTRLVLSEYNFNVKTPQTFYVMRVLFSFINFTNIRALNNSLTIF